MTITRSMPDTAARLERLQRLADLMDTRFRLPGVPVSLGWDTIIGLIPGIGDTLTTLIALYILREGAMLGVPRRIQWRMGFNIFLDWLIGLVPLVGDVFDIAWKANRRNMVLIRRYGRA